jgi:hypothetical protein
MSDLFLDPSTEAWELPAALVRGVAISPMNQSYLSQRFADIGTS